MKTIDFKQYTIGKIEELKKEITSIDNNLTKLSNPSDVILEEYGTKKELIALYKSHVKKHLLQKLFIPSQKELQNFIYNYERHLLTNKKTKINKQIKILEKVVESLIENSFVKDVPSFSENSSHKYIIQQILEYSEKDNIKPSEIVDLLISLFRQTIKDYHVESQLESDISNNFDRRNYPYKRIKIEDLLFSFNKLFITVLGEDYISKYPVSINGINNEIQLRHQKINSLEGARNILLEEQQALLNLQEYIQGNKIIKATPDFDSFKKDLKKAGLEQGTIIDYIQQMERKIEEEKIAHRQAEDKRVLQKYLSPEHLAIFNEACSLIPEISSEELDNLLSRSIKDVISLCRYLELVESDSREFLENIERVTGKINILQTEIAKIKKPSIQESRFNYLINSDGLPIMLRSLDALDTTLYAEVYYLLNELSIDETVGTTINKVNGFNICAISGHELTLRYIKKGNNIFISNVVRRSEKINPMLTESEFNNIQHILTNANTKEMQNFQKTCEDLILHALNLYNPEEPYGLTKKIN